MSGPYVVNRHHVKGSHPKGSIYVGRPGPIAWQEVARGCLDGTALCNPDRRRDDGNLARYRRHLWDGLRFGRSDWLALFEQITPETRLVCSCAPRPCHADVIVRAWRWWSENRSRGG